MSLKKRANTWHTDFFVDGQRFRQSLETSDWREAQRKERTLINDAKAGKLAATRDEFSRLSFREAAQRFLEDRIPRLAMRSIQTERERLKPINLRLGNVQVRRINPDMVHSYIRGRKAEGRANATVNRELDVLRGVLKKAKRWHLFAEEIRPLPVRENIGRALPYEAKLELFQRAAARPEWQNAACAARLAANTTMRSSEIKGVRIGDLNFIERSVVLKKTKTGAGDRMIPLNSDAWAAVLELHKRSQLLGAVDSSHFLFPSCEHGYIDPTRPMKSWRTAWRNLTRSIECPGCSLLQKSSKVCSNCSREISDIKSPFASFRFHDLRHQAITELAESNASDQTIKSIAGHVSRKMLEHYSHIRMAAKRNALDALTTKPTFNYDSRRTSEGYDTTNDTNFHREMSGISQTVDSLVELSGIEPLTSSLRTRRSPS
jgi:integrase